MRRTFLCLTAFALGAMMVAASAVEAAPKGGGGGGGGSRGGGGGGGSRGGASSAGRSSGGARTSSPARSSGSYQGGNYRGNYNHGSNYNQGGNYNHGNYNHGNYNRGYYPYYYPGLFFGLGGFPYYYYGGRGNGGYGGYGGGYSYSDSYDPSYYYNNGNGAGYPPQLPPQDEAVALTDADVLFNVRVPAGATVWFNGDKTSQTGAQREFLSSGLTPGRNYTYEVRARWMQDGQEVDRTQKIKVRGGERRIVDFLATE